MVFFLLDSFSFFWYNTFGDTMLYSSLQNPKIKEICKLKQKKYRDQKGLFLVEGKVSVMEAYHKNVLREVFVREGFSFSLPIPTSLVTDTVMKHISSLESIPSIIGLCAKPTFSHMGDRIVILENIQDPGNIGTIVRSAVAFHASAVVLLEGCADPYGFKALRAMQGMIFHIPIFTLSFEEIYSFLKQNKIPLYGTKVNGGKEVFRLYKKEKFAIIMGNEGQGLREHTLSFCDDYLSIPMNTLCESLNVGVATSILLYELDKK